MLVETKDDDKYGEFRLDSDGNASVTTYNKGFFGLVTNKETNTFSIDYFDGERIKIVKDCVNSTDMDACLSSIENYINNSEYNSTNYIAEYGEDLEDGICTEEDKCLTEEQYDEVENNLINEYNNNNLNVKESDVGALAVASGLVTTYGPEIAIKTEAAPAVLTGLGIAALAYAGVYIIDGAVHWISEIKTTTNDIENDGTWEELDEEELEKVKENYEDDNPNNDYYQAMLGRNHSVYINFVYPMSIDSAANYLLYSEPFSTNNLYTYDDADARRVIEHAGENPGIAVSPRKLIHTSSKNLAENHAFNESYNLFNPNDINLNIPEVSLKENITPGIYYWHYHFNNKKLIDMEDDIIK